MVPSVILTRCDGKATFLVNHRTQWAMASQTVRSPEAIHRNKSVDRSVLLPSKLPVSHLLGASPKKVVAQLWRDRGHEMWVVVAQQYLDGRDMVFSGPTRLILFSQPGWLTFFPGRPETIKRSMVNPSRPPGPLECVWNGISGRICHQSYSSWSSCLLPHDSEWMRFLDGNTVDRRNPAPVDSGLCHYL